MLPPIQEVELSREELLRAIQRDCVSFLSFYLEDELTLEVPEFHIEIWDEFLDMLDTVNHPDFLIGHLQKLFAVPREHSKSTLAKLAVILFMRYSVLSVTLYVSKTATVAMQAAKDIFMWLTSRQEHQLYGSPTVYKKNESEGLWVLGICVPGRTTQKRIIIKAIGAQHQVRGTLIENKRPDLIIMDDIEDYDTADGGLQQEKLDEWALGSLLKSSAKRSIRIMLGNMVRKTTLLARLSSDSKWNPTVFGAIVKDKVTGQLKPLWEGRWTLEALLEEYMEYRRLGKGHIWETEMMNLNTDLLFTQSLEKAVILPPVNPEELIAGFIVLDPAFGLNAWNDESSLTVHAKIKGCSKPILIDKRTGRFSESAILDEFINLSYYWNIATWCIEAVAAQKLLLSLFRLMLIERQISPDVFTMIPVTTSQSSKASRILAFRSAVASGEYLLSEAVIETKLKLEQYNPDSTDHDDECDSAAYGTIVWNLHGKVIEEASISNVAGRIMQQVSSNSQAYGENDVCTF